MREQQRILIAVMLTCFIGPFMASSVNVAIPAMSISFQESPEALTWAVTAFLIGSAAVLLAFGRLSDIKGRRKIYTIGLICTCITTLITGVITNYNWFIISRFIQGLTMSMIFGTSMALLISCYEPEKRGKIIGLASGCVYIGLSIGPFLGGLITDYLSWRYIFYFTSIALIFNILLVLGIKEEWYGAFKQKFDYLGALLSTIIILLFLFTLSTWTTYPYIHYVLVIAFCLLLVFLWHQNHITHPVLELKLFKNKVFTFSNTAALIHYSATFAIGFLLSLYLQILRGLDASTAGLFLLIQPLLMALLSPLFGSLSDKYPPRYLSSGGMLVMLIGIFYFHHLTMNTSLWLIGVSLAIIGIGFSLFSAPNNNAIMGAVMPKHYGIASSILAVMRLIGQALSMAIVTLFLATYVGKPGAQYAKQLLSTIDYIFLIFTFLCILGIACSWYRPKHSTPKD